MQDLHKKKDRMEPRSSADVIRRQRWELVRAQALQPLHDWKDKKDALSAHELFKVRVWLGLQGFKA